MACSSNVTTPATSSTRVSLTEHVNREIDAAKSFDYANQPLPKVKDSVLELISLEPFTKPSEHSEQDRQKVLDQLQKSCEHCGFFLLTDHGVDPSLILKAHQVSTHFFQEAPRKEKESLSGQYYLGYTCSENVSAYQGRGGKKPEPVEKFSVFAEGSERNVWPKTNADEFKTIVTKYYETCHELGQLLEHLTERIMGVPEGTIRAQMCDTMKSGVVRLHLYNAQDNVQEVLGGHTDLSTITLVSTTKPGYEVLVDGQWQPVPHIGPEVFVVNLGDLYKAWTNGIFKSSIHRVNSLFLNDRRSSINYFATTVAEFDNEPLIPIQTFEPFVGRGVRYTPFYLRWELKRRFGLLKVEEEEDGPIAVK